jgi:7,8-dihydroneopterin aldolase/epimerase/oxygenase
VSYEDLVKTASGAFSARRYRLVEAAGGAVADAVLQRYPAVQSIRVTVRKPQAPIAATFDDVGVIITRTRQA